MTQDARTNSQSAGSYSVNHVGAIPTPATLSNWINKNMKVVKTIVKITKQECIELQKLGHKFGSEGTLHHTWTKHHKYYLTESRKAMADLDKIRKSHIAKR